MTEGMTLPEDGPAMVGSVPLPAGRRVYGTGMGQPSMYDEPPYDQPGRREAVAWTTCAPMADAGDAWLALSALHLETGLVPVLLSADGILDEPLDEPWEPALGFHGREDLGLIAAMDPRSVLAGNWDLSEEEYRDPDVMDTRDPFRGAFPGLAPAQQERLPMATLREAVTEVTAEQPALLGLVAAGRPADIPAAVGWSVFGSDRPGGPEAVSLGIATVLRSWEARFGARPLWMGGSVLRVLVERPPATLEAAIGVAAEHLAFASEYGERAGRPVREYAAELAGQPSWRFWWD